MKKAALVLLAVVTLVSAYSPYSFRYQSTAGILWDDYDWFITDPARIPIIEGAQLYTNLANFVSGNENPLSDSLGFQGPGFFLIGGKAFGPPLGAAGVFDTRMLRLADPTGIGTYEGYGTQTDTSYMVDPNDGSILGTSVTTDIVEAYRTRNDFDGFLGLGYQLNETFNLGFAYDHNSARMDSIDPGSNTISITRNYDDAGSLTDLDTVYSWGRNVQQEMSNRVRLGMWTSMDYLQISGYLGAELFSGDQGRDTVLAYGFSENYVGMASSTSSWENDLTSWRYSGLAVPLEVLAVYELDEGQDLWFWGGFEYNFWNWKDGAGVSNVATDTSLQDYDDGGTTYTSTSINETTDLTVGSGSGSGMAYSLGTKGVFALNDMITFGLGVGFRGSNSKDSTQNDHSVQTYADVDDGDGVGEYDDYVTTTSTSQSDYEINKTFVMAFDFPVGVEFRPWEPVAFRLGATYTYQMNTFTEHLQGVGTIVSSSNTTRGDGTTESTTTYSPYTIANDEGKQKETASDIVYDFGIGFMITDNFQLDLMGFSDLRSLNNWKLSAVFKF